MVQATFVADNSSLLDSVTTTTTSFTVTSNRVWRTWNRAYVLQGTYGSTDSAIIETCSTTATASSAQIWAAWNIAFVHDTITTGTMSVTTNASDPWPWWNRDLVRQARDVRISNEEYQRRVADAERARVEAEGERAQARERARILLREHLTEAQKAELAEKRYFSLSTIDSKTGERRHYRIHQGRAGNVEQVDENGRKLKRFCIHPYMDVPDEDTMLTQMLWLKTREAEFRRIANHS